MSVLGWDAEEDVFILKDPPKRVSVASLWTSWRPVIKGFGLVRGRALVDTEEDSGAGNGFEDTQKKKE